MTWKGEVKTVIAALQEARREQNKPYIYVKSILVSHVEQVN